MAGETQVVETQTAMASAIKSRTDSAIAAVAESGFADPAFDEALQAALDKDAGKAPAQASSKDSVQEGSQADDKPEVPAATAAQSQAKPTLPKGDLPSALIKKTDTAAATATTSTDDAAERQRFLDEQTKGMTPKAAERFKKIESRAYEAEQKAKAAAAEKEAEVAALKKQFEAEKAAAAAAPKVESEEILALKKQIQELDAVAKKASILEHPGFKAKYDGQISNEIERIKKYLPQDIAEDVALLLAMPESTKRNEKLSQAADKLDGITTTKLFRTLDVIDRLQIDKATEIANWKENAILTQATTVQQQQEQEAKANQLREIAWHNGMKMVSAPDSDLEVFQRIPGEDAWNATVDERVANAKKLLYAQNLPPEAMVEMAARAVAAKDYRDMFFAQRALVAKLQEENAALKSAAPSTDGTAGVDSTPDSDDFATAVVRNAVRAGGVKG